MEASGGRPITPVAANDDSGRRFWASLTPAYQQRIRDGLSVGLIGDFREWVDRRVEQIQPIDYACYRRRVSYQVNITPELFSDWVKALGLLQGGSREAAESLDNPETLDGQEIDVHLPIELYPKRVLLDFSVASTDGSPLRLIQRRDASLISIARVYAEFKSALRDGGLNDEEADALMADLINFDEVLFALIISANDEGRSIYARNGVSSKARRYANCPLPACERRRLRSTLRLLEDQLCHRFVGAGNDTVFLRRIEPGIKAVLELSVVVAQMLDAEDVNYPGLHSAFLNPLLLIVDHLKHSEERGAGWADENLDEAVNRNVDEFLKMSEAYLRWLIRVGKKHPTTIVALYHSLSGFENYYLPYVRITLKLGRSEIIKTEQVIPLVRSWVNEEAQSAGRGRRLAAMFGALPGWAIDTARFGVILTSKAIRWASRGVLCPANLAWSTRHAIGHETLLGVAKSCHVEVECANPTELLQDTKRTFITVAGRRLRTEAVFPFAASASRERQHFYTTKSQSELLRVWKRDGVAVPAKGHAFPLVMLWIAYKIDVSLNLTYWFGLLWVLVTTIVVWLYHEPKEPGGSQLASVLGLLPIVSAAVAFMMNWRSKENIVADRLVFRRMAALFLTGATGAIIVASVIAPGALCATRGRAGYVVRAAPGWLPRIDPFEVKVASCFTRPPLKAPEYRPVP